MDSFDHLLSAPSTALFLPGFCYGWGPFEAGWGAGRVMVPD